MKYERSFLDKCLKLIEDSKTKAFPNGDLQARLKTLFATHCKNSDVIVQFLDDPESLSASERAGALGLEGLHFWEEGFQLVHDFFEQHDLSLLEEASILFNKGNEAFNKVNGLYLDASEEDEIKFVM